MDHIEKEEGFKIFLFHTAIEEFKPEIHICGHIHETHGIEEKIGSTTVINVGKTGKIIEL